MDRRNLESDIATCQSKIQRQNVRIMHAYRTLLKSTTRSQVFARAERLTQRRNELKELEEELEKYEFLLERVGEKDF